MGKLRPLGNSPNNGSLLIRLAVVIVKLLSNMSLRSFRIAVAKILIFWQKERISERKMTKGAKFVWKDGKRIQRQTDYNCTLTFQTSDF